jgi:hypothetical protein
VSAAPASQSATNFLYQLLKIWRSSFLRVEFYIGMIAASPECLLWVESGRTAEHST